MKMVFKAKRERIAIAIESIMHTGSPRRPNQTTFRWRDLCSKGNSWNRAKGKDRDKAHCVHASLINFILIGHSLHIKWPFPFAFGLERCNGLRRTSFSANIINQNLRCRVLASEARAVEFHQSSGTRSKPVALVLSLEEFHFVRELELDKNGKVDINRFFFYFRSRFLLRGPALLRLGKTQSNLFSVVRTFQSESRLSPSLSQYLKWSKYCLFA